MAIRLADVLESGNGRTPIAYAKDIQMSDGKRLSEIELGSTKVVNFDLAAMGIPNLMADGDSLEFEMDTAKIIEAAAKGNFSLTLNIAYAGLVVKNIEVTFLPTNGAAIVGLLGATVFVHLLLKETGIILIACVDRSLPIITTADNDKVLKVVNGEWKADDASSGGVSSWNDLTDKPFYEESREVEILPEQSIPVPAMQVSPAPFVLVEGETYRVVLNGVEHRLVCENSGGYLALNNLVQDENGEFLDGSFSIAYIPGELSATGKDMVGCEISVSGDTATAAIYHMYTVLQQIDPKFIPTPYFGETEEVEPLLEETELGFSYTSQIGLYANINPSAQYPIVLGQEYSVLWEGQEFRCVAFVATEFNNFPAIGNAQAAGGADDKIPFIIAYNPDANYLYYAALDTKSTHKVGVSKVERVVTQIASKYLPMDAIDARIDAYIEEALGGEF